MKVVNTQIAYILHKRPYRETSSILDVLTKDFGRVSLLARGCRGPRSKIAGNLLLFTPLVISWQGKGDLPYLKSVERAELKAPVLKNKSLLSAMYVNELLMYLLHKEDIHTEVFEQYHHCLYSLENKDQLEITLRLFELKLLELLGFGLNLYTEAESGEAVQANQTYLYYIEHGLVKNKNVSESVETGSSFNNNAVLISGRCLFALQDDTHQSIALNSQYLAELKKLLRCVIAHHLGNKKLKSRELFKPVLQSS